MRHIIGSLILATTLVGCAPSFWGIEPQLFDGVEFRTKSGPVDRDTPKLFEVSVRPVSASPTGARAAAKFEATSYCISRFGKSDVKWSTDPDAEVLPVTDDILILQGRCDP